MVEKVHALTDYSFLSIGISFGFLSTTARALAEPPVKP